MVRDLILIASRVFWGRMAFAITDGLLASAVLMLIDTPASYVVRFHGNESDEGNGIVV